LPLVIEITLTVVECPSLSANVAIFQIWPQGRCPNGQGGA
jgi:hypothetical protein